MMECKEIGCYGKHKAQGFCNKHYRRWLKYGDPNHTNQVERIGGSVEERLKHHMDFKTCRNTTKCWLWTGSLNHLGYGRISIDGKFYYAHRLVWKYWMDEDGIPDDLEYIHDPDGIYGCPKRCVNPHHATIGTRKENFNSWDYTGERHHEASVLDFNVERVRRLYAKGGITQQELADMVGVSRMTVYRWIKEIHRSSKIT